MAVFIGAESRRFLSFLGTAQSGSDFQIRRFDALNMIGSIGRGSAHRHWLDRGNGLLVGPREVKGSRGCDLNDDSVLSSKTSAVFEKKSAQKGPVFRVIEGLSWMFCCGI